MPTVNKGYLSLTILLFFIEVIIALYFHDHFVRPYLGDFLVVILIYCTVKSIGNLPVLQTSIAVLLFSYLIEVLQYLDFVHRIGLGDSQLATTVIGTTFQWGDILAYTLGVGVVVLVEKFRKKPNDTVG